MEAYIKKVFINGYAEFQVWSSGILVATRKTIHQANRMMMKEMKGIK